MALITTTLGEMDDSLLVKATGTDETDDAIVTWVVYRLHDPRCSRVAGDVCDCPGHGAPIHRSVHANIKATATAFAKGDLF